MFYKKIEAKDLFNKKEEDKQVTDLLETENAHLKAVYMKKNNSFNSHTSHTNVFIYIIEGELEIIFHEKHSACNICGCSITEDDDNKAEKYKLKENQMFMFEKEVKHSIKALKDVIFLLVKM